jgi:rhomboid protease GluP
MEQLLPTADPPLRLAIERRLSRLSMAPEPLDEYGRRVIDEAARELSHDASFGASRSLFSRNAWATQLLIILNLVMFLAETRLGGATNGETLYRLGGLFGPAVRAGEWWRLCASLFLHWGWLHLAMNMLALWVLGPFAEAALGSIRYLFVYLLSGIGSMWAVLMWSSAANRDQLTVGASGCVMGLIGATGALMLRGWLRERALIAKRRLTGVLIIVVMQTTFDLLVPHVSMTAHLSGAMIGFVCTLALRDRLRAAKASTA